MKNNTAMEGYVFSGFDIEGFKSDKSEMMKYEFGDDAIVSFANQTVRIPSENNRIQPENECPESWVCDTDKQSRLRAWVFEVFPSLRCHPRTGEDAALSYLERNRSEIVRFSDEFKIPAVLFAAILYTEMTWSRIGYRNANALSYIKGRIDGNGGSLGPGQIQTKHYTRWHSFLSVKQASSILYYDEKIALRSSARLLGEIYQKAQLQRSREQSEYEYWSDVAERYNSASGNQYYRTAFQYSLKTVRKLFPAQGA